ncbi:hypothetical protein HN51_054312 [Arachis hypogaea]|uniref:Uncharacterized protein n=1 Tax=Arachis hypogaea TaxID=3818 RepID=A0A6B9V6A0_ARAHY|nr:uncharacterized protein DS421_19g647550 [Arachis hypogaea]
MAASNFYDQGRHFYMEINPDLDMGETPSIFFRRFKDGLPNFMTFHDFAENEVDVVIEKCHHTAIIVAGYNSLVTLYGLKESGWLKVCYVGREKFLIIEVKDHNIVAKCLYFPPLKLSINIKPTIAIDETISLSKHTSVASPVNQETVSSKLGESPQILHNEANLQSNSDFVLHGGHFITHSVFNVSNPVEPTAYSGMEAPYNNTTILSFDDAIAQPPHDPIKQVLSMTIFPAPPQISKPLNQYLPSTLPSSNPNMSNISVGDLNCAAPISPFLPPDSIPGEELYSIVRVIPEYQSKHYSLLILSAFAAQAFPLRLDFIHVRQLHKPPILMKLHWRSPRSSEAFVTRGWCKFSVANGLRCDRVLHLSVPVQDETTMFVTILRI